jgi:hypothetical protein
MAMKFSLGLPGRRRLKWLASSRFLPEYIAAFRAGFRIDAWIVDP